MKPNWDEYFLNFLDIIAKRATCDRGYNSALIVDSDNQIVASGYVGSPSKMPECNEAGHDFYTMIYNGKETKHCRRTSHAEMNAIAQAAKRGVSTNNCKIYVKMVPCWECAKLLVTCGIKKIICQYDYQASESSKELFNKTEVELVIINKEEINYEKKTN